MLTTIEIPIDGVRRPFTFPPTEFMKQDIERVLSGVEYPLHLLGDFAPDVILDIGASVGMSSLYFHTMYPGADIYAFEPARVSHDCLARNLAGIPHIHIYDFGLLDRDDTLPLHHSNDGPTANSLATGLNQGSDHETIRVRRAADFVGRLGCDRIDILKIDTEGAELRILANLADWLPRTDVILLELHSDRARSYVDRLLNGRFVLRSAEVPTVNRITLMYVAANAINEGRCRTSIAPVLEV